MPDCLVVTEILHVAQTLHRVQNILKHLLYDTFVCLQVWMLMVLLVVLDLAGSLHRCIYDEVQAGVKVVKVETSQRHSSLHEARLTQGPRASLRPRRSTKQKAIMERSALSESSFPKPIKIKIWIPMESVHLSETEDTRLKAAVEEAVRTVSSILSGKQNQEKEN